MAIVPKGPRANVSDLDTARRKKGGRPSGDGYDPATGEDVHRSDGETDVFSVVGNRGYSEHRFYTRSVDANGHGEKMQVRVPQGLDSQIYGAVREIPEYRHANDFWRDAAVHRLEYLQRRYRLTDETRRWLELERWRADSEKRSAEIQTMTAAVEDVAAKLEEAWKAKDFSLFAQELDEAEEQIDWLREPYRSRVVNILHEWKRQGREELDRIRQQLEE